MKDKKKQKSKEKGITLIALVVTIIILLILAGVTLNMAMSGDGLFSGARNAADKYKKAQEDETKLISEIGKEMNSEYVGAKVTWNDFEEKKGENAYKVEAIKSGAENEQTFETEEFGWRIWDYDGTTIRIISDKPTTKELTLKGVEGYNNGVYLINEICRQCYGQYETDGKTKKTGISVANLRRSDIEAVSNYDYTKYKHKASGDDPWKEVLGEENGEKLIYYGETKKYEISYQSPSMWEKNDKNWAYKYNAENKTSSGNKSIEVPWEQEYRNSIDAKEGTTTNETVFTQSYYHHDYLNRQGEFKNAKYYDLLFEYEQNENLNSTYWLAGRDVGLYEDYCTFGVLCVGTHNDKYRLAGAATFYSNRECW